MEREISFRGISKETKAMVYGAYFTLHHDDQRTHIHHFIIPENTPIPKEKPIGEIQIEVDPATVGQYAFLDDINDKKIFTADILQDKITSDLYVVDFIGGGFGLFTMKEYLDLKHRHAVILWDGLSELQTSCFVTQNLRVIGNIHDNPELLKEVTE